jgi:internalin A
MSETPKYILEKIREAKEKQLKELDLSSRDLIFIPLEVFELTQLEVLRIQ